MENFLCGIKQRFIVVTETWNEPQRFQNDRQLQFGMTIICLWIVVGSLLPRCVSLRVVVGLFWIIVAREVVVARGVIVAGCGSLWLVVDRSMF